jgi:hypothetical protein
MFTQMRSPFSGKWVKIDADDGTIVECADAAWPDFPHVRMIALPPSQEVPRALPLRRPRAIDFVVRETVP